MATEQQTEFGVRVGAMDCRYVTAKLGKMRMAREWLVQPTSDDRIIVQGSRPSKPGRPTPYADCIGIFGFDGKGRLTTKGGYFPHLAFAEPFEFPADFVAVCMDVCQPLDTETTGHGFTVRHTVQVVS